MKNARVAAAISALLLAFAANIHGQDVKVGGQIRPRTELRDNSTTGDAFTTMRVRLNLLAALDPRVRAFVQAQDVRMWGEENSTTSNTDRIDLHQGYIELGDAVHSNTRVGRQELVYGEERLVGASDWGQQGRALDGVRAHLVTKHATIDGFGFQIADAGAPGKTMDDRFFGAYGTVPGKCVSLDAYLLRNQNSAAHATRQNTVGTRIYGTHGMLLYRAELALQRGTRNGFDTKAGMSTAYVGVTRGRGQALLWVDHLSGDSNPADSVTRVFDTVYATNHKFYGIADIFTNIPTHTANRGLNDYAIKTTFRARPDLTFNGDVHSFRAAAASGLKSAQFGNELDLIGTYRYSPKLTVLAGAARFHAGAGLREVLPATSSQTFTYLMLNAAF